MTIFATTLNASRGAHPAPEDHRTPHPVNEGLTGFYRWGWVPLVAGCLVLAVVDIVVWEIALHQLVRVPVPERGRWIYVGRAVTTAALLASWVGWYVLHSRKKLEAAREELRRHEVALREEERLLEQAAGRAAMLRILGHEIRNPLNGLLLHCRALRRTFETLPDETRAEAILAADTVEAEARRVGTLIDDYMTYGRAQTFTMAADAVDLAALATSVTRSLDEKTERRRVRVSVEMPSGLPRVHGDRHLLGLALHHALRNSIEAVPEGGCAAIRAGVVGNEVVLDVVDDGPGFVDPALAVRPFYTTKPGGAGLGLTVVRDVLRAHRGTVTVDNDGIDGGARVRMRLPLGRNP